jgi:hypothetical protein
VPAQCAIYGRYGFAAAHRRCVVGISALGARPSRGARARAHACARGPPHPVGVRQHEQSRKHFSPHIRVRPKIYVGHEPRTTVDFPFNRKDVCALDLYSAVQGPVLLKLPIGLQILLVRAVQ